MIYSSLTIAALPLEIATGRKQKNLQGAAEAVARVCAAGGVDVVVLPELFTTGFVRDRELCARLAEDANGETMKAVRCWATAHRVAIVGSMLHQGSAVSNRAFFVEPDGETTVYDKRHLFTLSPESNMLTAGETLPPVVRFRGWNLAMIVCFDLRFPVWCRNRFDRRPYDAMLVPANWPEARAQQWHALLCARAIENQAYWIGADCSGTDDFGSYPASMTCAYDALGSPTGQRSADALIVTLDRTHIEQVRSRLPFAAAADSFSLQL